MKNRLLSDALALFLITLVSGFALSAVYEVTREPIAVQAEQKALKANQAVFPEASAFDEDKDLTALLADTDLSAINADYAGVTIDTVSRALDGGNRLLGYNITVSSSAGYKDGIQFVFGYALDGTIQGIEFLSLSETAGLGMLAKEPEFKDQFLGKQTRQFTVTKTGAESEDQIDAISSATITSKAVTNAVNAGIYFVSANGLQKEAEGNE